MALCADTVISTKRHAVGALCRAAPSFMSSSFQKKVGGSKIGPKDKDGLYKRHHCNVFHHDKRSDSRSRIN
jgi:hypothetical protein